jgi:hypothetical protein
MVQCRLISGYSNNHNFFKGQTVNAANDDRKYLYDISGNRVLLSMNTF